MSKRNRPDYNTPPERDESMNLKANIMECLASDKDEATEFILLKVADEEVTVIHDSTANSFVALVQACQSVQQLISNVALNAMVRVEEDGDG